MPYLLSLLTALIMFPSIAIADVQSGTAIPTKLSLSDQNGTVQSFDTLKGDNGLILVFVRSADWCPYCQAQLKELNQAHDQFTTLGFNLVSISYDPVPTLQKFANKHKINYPMLSDKGSETIKSFGIINEKMSKESRFYGIPHPHIYIVDATGKVSSILKEEGYVKRPKIDEIINAAKAQLQ